MSDLVKLLRSRNCIGQLHNLEGLEAADRIEFLEAEIERLTAERDEARARAEGLAEALTRVLMWAPRSTEAACEQDYEVARAALEEDDG